VLGHSFKNITENRSEVTHLLPRLHSIQEYYLSRKQITLCLTLTKKEVTNLPIQYLSNETRIRYGMEQMKRQSSEDVLSLSYLLLLLQTNENRVVLKG